MNGHKGRLEGEDTLCGIVRLLYCSPNCFSKNSLQGAFPPLSMRVICSTLHRSMVILRTKLRCTPSDRWTPEHCRQMKTGISTRKRTSQRIHHNQSNHHTEGKQSRIGRRQQKHRQGKATGGEGGKGAKGLTSIHRRGPRWRRGTTVNAFLVLQSRFLDR